MNFKKHNSSLFFALFSFFICSLVLSCADQTGENPAHEQAVAIADSVQHYYDIALESVGEMKEIKNQLEENFEATESPDSTLAQALLDINKDIAIAEGLTEKQRILIEQHKDYIDRHENSALSAEKIKMFHQQINNDFNMVKKDMVVLEKFLYLAKTRADKFLNEDVGVIFYKK